MSDIDPTRDRKFRAWYPKLADTGVHDDDRTREVARQAWRAAWLAKPVEPREQTNWCALCLLGSCRPGEGHIKIGHRKEAVTVFYGDALCEHCVRVRRDDLNQRAAERKAATENGK